MAARACVVVVETRPENVRHNPREQGLSAGVSTSGAVYVRCNAVVLDSGCLVTTAKAAEWLVDIRQATWRAGTTSLLLDTLVPLGGSGRGHTPCFGLLLLRPARTEEALAHVPEASVATEATRAGLFVCGTPFGSNELAGCCFPVQCGSVCPHFGVVRLGPVPLCEGLDGAPVVRAADRALCGVVLCAQTGAAWLPNGDKHLSLCLSLRPAPASCDCVVGLLGERVWASGIVLSTCEEERSAVVATCAHFVAQCEAIGVWANGKQIGTAKPLSKHRETTLDVAVLSVKWCTGDSNPLRSARCRRDAVPAGTSVTAVGFHSFPPNRATSTGPQQRHGVAVRSGRPGDAWGWLVTTCDAGCGSSGGAVVDSTGTVVGMQCRSYDGHCGTSLALACPIAAVLGLVACLEGGKLTACIVA